MSFEEFAGLDTPKNGWYRFRESRIAQLTEKRIPICKKDDEYDKLYAQYLPESEKKFDQEFQRRQNALKEARRNKSDSRIVFPPMRRAISSGYNLWFVLECVLQVDRSKYERKHRSSSNRKRRYAHSCKSYRREFSEGFLDYTKQVPSQGIFVNDNHRIENDNNILNEESSPGEKDQQLLDDDGNKAEPSTSTICFQNKSRCQKSSKQSEHNKDCLPKRSRTTADENLIGKNNPTARQTWDENELISMKYLQLTFEEMSCNNFPKTMNRTSVADILAEDDVGPSTSKVCFENLHSGYGNSH